MSGLCWLYSSTNVRIVPSLLAFSRNWTLTCSMYPYQDDFVQFRNKKGVSLNHFKSSMFMYSKNRVKLHQEISNGFRVTERIRLECNSAIFHYKGP